MNWKIQKAEDYCAGVTDGTHDSPKAVESGRYLITSKHLGEYEIDFSSAKLISEEDYKKVISRSKVAQWDILFSMIGTIGNTYLEKNEIVEYACKNMGIFQMGGDKQKAYWLYYYLKSPQAYQYIVSQLRGSTQQYVPLGGLREFPIPVPSDHIRDKIIDVLKVIDEKIETNKRINRNLSEQMQALFASVFYPEIEAGNKVSLGDYLYIKGRIGWKGLKKDEYLDESEYRIINGESLTATGIDWAKAGYISEERYIESPEIMLQEGDILISKDGTIGKIGYVNKLEKPTSVASGIFVVRNLKPEEVSTVFIYCLLNSDYFKSFIASRTEGSVIPHLYQKDFVTLEIPLLTQEQLNIFNGSVNPLFELYFTNQTENIRLTALRDTLLPRLMSGELDVSDINI